MSGLSIWSLHVLPMLTRVSSGCSKLSVGMSEIMNVCLCASVLDWPSVQSRVRRCLWLEMMGKAPAPTISGLENE